MSEDAPATQRNKRDHGESDSEEHLPVKKARSDSGALIRVYLGAITGCDVKYAYVTWGNSIEEICQNVCLEIFQDQASVRLKKLPTEAFYFEYHDADNAQALTLLTPTVFEAQMSRGPKPPELIMKIKSSFRPLLVAPRKMNFTVTMPDGPDVEFIMKNNMPFKRLYHKIAKTRGIRINDFNVTFEGQPVSQDATPLSIDLENNAQMRFQGGQLGDDSSD